MGRALFILIVKNSISFLQSVNPNSFILIANIEREVPMSRWEYISRSRSNLSRNKQSD